MTEHGVFDLTGAEVGAAVVWLASDAGGLVNGQVIHLNGGVLHGR